MRIEIVHDTLARRVFEKASAEDKMRLKIANFIRQRYQYYLDSNKNGRALLKRSDLNYVEPYVDRLVLSEEEQIFLRRSRSSLKRRYILTAIGIGIALVASVVYGQWVRTTKNQLDAVNHQLHENTTKLEKTTDSLRNVNAQFAEAQNVLKAISATLKIGGNSNEEIVKKTAEHVVQLDHAKRTIDSLNRELKKELERQQNELTKKTAQCNNYMQKIGELSKDNKTLAIKVENLATELEKERKLNKGGGGGTTLIGNTLSEAVTLNNKAESLLKTDKNAAFHLATAAYERVAKSNDRAAAAERDKATRILRECASGRISVIDSRNAPPDKLIKQLSTSSHFGGKWSEADLKQYLK